MRPDILNPLFAEISVLKGIGPALARPLERLGLAKGFTHGPPLEHKTAIKLKWGDAAAADRLRDGSLLVICDEQDRANAKARAAVARAAAVGPGDTAQRPSSRQWRGEPSGVSFAFGGVGGGGGRPGSGSEAQGTDRYLWHDASWVRDAEPNADGTTLAWGARMAHGTTSRKRAIEGPQLCHRMGPVQPIILRGSGYVAVQTEYTYDFAAPGRNAGST